MHTSTGDEIKIHLASRDRSGFRGFAHAVALLAHGQRGLVTRWQLLELGMTSAAIGRAVADGHLHLVHLGVYAVGHHAITREAELLAAVLAGGADSVLSHSSAAELWGFPATRDRRAHVIAASHDSRPRVVFHRCRLATDEWTVHKGMPVTAPVRTIIDVAPSHTIAQLERIIRQAEYDHLLTTTSLEKAVAIAGRRRGIKTLRMALALSCDINGNPRSTLERRFLGFIRRHRLPRPKINFRIELGDREVIADCAWPDERLIVELDSHKAHDNRHSFESDRTRDRALLVAGWRSTRVTWRQLHDSQPELAADLRALLHEIRIGLA